MAERRSNLILLILTINLCDYAETARTVPLPQERLINFLKFQSGNLAVPTTNGNESLKVYLQFGLHDIRCDSRTLLPNSVRAVIWWEQQWNDASLDWDPKAFGGVKEVQMPVPAIWNPGVRFMSSAIDALMSVLSATVKTKGPNRGATVSISFPIKVDVSCSSRVLKFPFESVICVTSVFSQPYSKRDVILIADGSVVVRKDCCDTFPLTLALVTSEAREHAYHGEAKSVVDLEITLRHTASCRLALILPIPVICVGGVLTMFVGIKKELSFAVINPVVSLGLLMLFAYWTAGRDVMLRKSYYVIYMLAMAVVTALSPLLISLGSITSRFGSRVNNAEMQQPTMPLLAQGERRKTLHQQDNNTNHDTAPDETIHLQNSMLQEIRDVKFIASTTYINHLECHRRRYAGRHTDTLSVVLIVLLMATFTGIYLVLVVM